MKKNLSPHLSAILLALLVTFLWSTSFVIIKLGLKEIPPLTFAGLRYSIAFVCLLPFIFTKKNIPVVKNLEKNDWIKLILLGILFYAFTQGTQFIGLSLLPAVTVSLWLNFTPLVVAVMAIFLIKEFPTQLQWIGVGLFIIGILTYFYPVSLSEDQSLGLVVMTIGVFANSSSAVLGRSVNRKGNINPLVVTVVSMGIGSAILLVTGIIIQGFPAISFENVLYLLWLAIINTALAFTIWNYTLRTLTAMESSIINGTMLIQIAVLAWVFLGEAITIKEISGMFIATIGAALVQLKLKKPLKS
ncbi:MAG TPA: DMT family transporter [Ignavibacteriaceae bacterium]|nr:DMT family transporter [Ignavibacteriaceae bacterium]